MLAEVDGAILGGITGRPAGAFSGGIAAFTTGSQEVPLEAL
ncbi:hypothetical protein [Bartonella mastomydis]|nr:hypothetical protein [Bartonella mastomydis]